MGLALGREASDEVEDPVFVIPRHIYFTPTQMQMMIDMGQQPGVPFRVGGNGAQRPNRPITKSYIIENLATIEKKSFSINISDNGKFSVNFVYDSALPLALYIHFGAKDSVTSNDIRSECVKSRSSL
jgi:hypothetical protein